MPYVYIVDATGPTIWVTKEVPRRNRHRVYSALVSSKDFRRNNEAFISDLFQLSIKDILRGNSSYHICDLEYISFPISILSCYKIQTLERIFDCCIKTDPGNNLLYAVVFPDELISTLSRYPKLRKYIHVEIIDGSKKGKARLHKVLTALAL